MSALHNYMSNIEHSKLESIYRHRFGDDKREQRLKLWETLCNNWFQRYVPADAVVLDLAAGQCEFINQISCGRKIAVDLNEDIRNFANDDVEIVIAYSHDMVGVSDDSVDIVFVSNFFEHLPTKQAFLDTLYEIRRVLKPGGRLLVLQPNIRFLSGAYWDFVDHYLPLTHHTLEEALDLVNMEVVEMVPQFLPYTTRSSLPKSPVLVSLYLRLPLAWWIFGKQTWMVGRKP